MSQRDVFALKDSGFDDFLFADVGTEANGSGLTILSVLARLGKDPWAEAALWAKQPTDIAVDALTVNIGCMGLAQTSVENAHATASRLIKLLPGQLDRGRARSDVKPRGLTIQGWEWMMLVYFWLYVITNIGMALTPRPNAAEATPVAAAAAVSAAPAASPATLMAGGRP